MRAAMTGGDDPHRSGAERPCGLIIDDDTSIRELLTLHLEDRGWDVVTAGDLALGRALAAQRQPSVVILDVRLPDADGLEAIGPLRRVSDAPILVMTAFHDMRTTILAMRHGALDYIPKPVNLDMLDRALARVRSAMQATTSPADLLIDEGPAAGPEELVGHSPPMQALFKDIGKLVSTRATVLIRGESGTGKELVARVVHRYSTPERPFVAVNCAALVESLLESELFGHERGAFTGASSARPGKCELAADGTLFLDEIGDLSPLLQGKLLRLLQEREFERVGGTQRLTLRARVIAATHRDLEAQVRARLFREDLFQRLQVVTLGLPPLRDRLDDLPTLVHHLLRRVNQRMGLRIRRVPQPTLALLASRIWRGNVRELENTLTRAAVLCGSDTLDPHSLGPPPIDPSGGRESGDEQASATAVGIAVQPLRTLAEVEWSYIAQVLRSTGGHRGRTCAILGISRPTLERKIQRFGLPTRSDASDPTVTRSTDIHHSVHQKKRNVSMD